MMSPVLRDAIDIAGVRHIFVATPWYSPTLISEEIVEEARTGDSILQFIEPDKLRIAAENGEAVYQLTEYDRLDKHYTAHLVEGWTDPEVYARCLAEREAATNGNGLKHA